MSKERENLLEQWKRLRVVYFNVFNEDMEKFEKKHGTHPMFNSVVKHFDKSFKQINQIAEQEIEQFLEDKEQ